MARRGRFDAHDRALARDPRYRAQGAALVLVDLDRFKAVNDGRGHAAGDACLCEAAARLRRVFPEARLVARLGGDAFAVLLRAPLGPARIARILERAGEALARPVPWTGGPLPLSASIGATLVTGAPGPDLFAQADAALYAAKVAGRNAVRLFSFEEGADARSARRHRAASR